MKAVVCQRYGLPEVLHLAEVPRPGPRDDEVLARVRATTVTAADFRCRSFTVPWRFWIPARLFLGVFRPRRQVLGAEFAGEVEETGKAVARFKGETPMRTVAIVIEEAGRNYSAYAPEVPGCIATGATPKDTGANMRSALELHLKGMAEDGLDFRSDDMVVRQVTLGTK
jgi:NADPH:quinone reductase-like Zn-dependent oxidoreductase